MAVEIASDLQVGGRLGQSPDPVHLLDDLRPRSRRRRRDRWELGVRSPKPTEELAFRERRLRPSRPFRLPHRQNPSSCDRRPSLSVAWMERRANCVSWSLSKRPSCASARRKPVQSHDPKSCSSSPACFDLPLREFTLKEGDSDGRRTDTQTDTQYVVD